MNFASTAARPRLSWRGMPVLVSIAALAACEPSAPITETTPPVIAQPVPPPTPPGRTARSQAVADYFARVEQTLLSRGLLRTDGDAPDAPWDARRLVDTFVLVALHDEYVIEGDQVLERQATAPLRRWQQPIRIGLRFGPSVPDAQRIKDRATVADLVERLARATGHPIRVSDQNPNFWVDVLSEDERADMAPAWRARFPGLGTAGLQQATRMPLSTFCMVMAISNGSSPVYTGALAVIRSELPDRLRASCFHEEIAQGLGLANDSWLARPSLFNDDEEFATLTPLDEAMLRILYDPRLQPGMNEAQARPILEDIARKGGDADG